MATFNITGTYIQTQITDYITEGNYFALCDLLESFDMNPKEIVPELLKGKFCFTGSSREDNLNMELNGESIQGWEEVLYQSFRSVGIQELSGEVLDSFSSFIDDETASLFLTKEFFVEVCNTYPKLKQKYMIEPMSYFQLLGSVYSFKGRFSAIIDKKGDIYPCAYEEHNQLVPVLKFFGIIDNYNLGIGNYIRSIDGEHCYISNNVIKSKMSDLNMAICETLMVMCDNNFYDDIGRDIWPDIIKRYSLLHGNGNKYGMLQIFKKLNIVDTPRIFEDYSEITDNMELVVRSSPDYSMAGVLNSYNCTKETLQETIKKMEKDFDALNINADNKKCHYFVQERVSGRNGVASVSPYKVFKTLEQYEYDINVSISDDQGAIVNGQDGNGLYYETQIVEDLVRKISKKFNHNHNFQIEFVIDDEEKITLLQYRVLPASEIENTTEKLGKNDNHLGFIFRLFTKRFNREETIICDDVSNLKISDLEGKSLIITAQKSNNAHILSYAISHEISVIFGANVAELVGLDEFIIKNDYRVAYISK